MADEDKKLDIEEEVPAIEDEIKKPEKDEGKVDAAEREWNYQREPDAQDLEAPDIFSNFRKETLPIFASKFSNPFKRGKKGKKKIGKLLWEDDKKLDVKPKKPSKFQKYEDDYVARVTQPEISGNEKHRMEHPNTKEYSFYKSMLEFHDKIVGDVQSEEEPIGAQPTGTGRRVAGAPFKMGKGKKTGQRHSLLGSKVLPFGTKGKKGTKGRGAKQRQGGTTATTSGGITGGMGKLNATYEPKLNPKGHQIFDPKGGKVGQKKRRASGVKVDQTRSGAAATAIKQPSGKDSNVGSSGQILTPKKETTKVPREKPRSKKQRKRYFKDIIDQKRDSKGRGSKFNPKPASGELYRKQQAAEALARKLGITMPSSGSGAPKIAAMLKALKAWYGEIYGI